MDGVAEIESNPDLIPKSLSGKELPSDWPQIITLKDEKAAYSALYDPGEDTGKEPPHPQAERLSYELESGTKRLRFLAVLHSPKADELNYQQYQIIETRFKESPPQLVLIEGNPDLDFQVPNREEAIEHGEQYFMSYLVQEHNAHLKEGEQPILIEKGDIPNDILADEFKKIGHSDKEIKNFFDNRGQRQQDKMYEEEREIRDPYIIRNAAKKFNKFDRVDIVFGGGHAIRERKAWQEFFS